MKNKIHQLRIEKEKQTIEVPRFEHFDEYVITISPSILRNKLYLFRERLKDEFGVKFSASGAFATLIVLTTAESYKNFLWINGSTWKATFLLAFLFFIFRLIYGLVSLYKKYGNGNFENEDNFINSLEKNNLAKENPSRNFPKVKH